MIRVLVLMLGLACLGAACEEPVFEEPQLLGGVSVPAQTLEQGRRVYGRYCVTCHGTLGDGRGVAAFGQWPPPRDFRHAKFKFAGVQDRGLPSDVELGRVITQGLKGTSMRPWILQASELDAVIQYIKTFSVEGKGFRSERLKVKAPVIPPNPYRGKEQIADAIREGEKLYHVTFQCSSCHPAYVDAEQFKAWDVAMRTESPYASLPKWSANYRTVLLPPDFLRHDMRAVRATESQAGLDHELTDLYRSIAFGLQGPMPGYVHLGEDQVWQVALYVKSLADRKGRAGAKELRRSLVAP